MDMVPQQYPEPAEPLRAQHVGDETVIVLDDHSALVASQSETDVWHVVEQDRCSCKAFRFRGTCRHSAVVERLRAPRVRKGDWPKRWGGPAQFDESELDAPPPSPGTDTELARIFGWSE